MEKQTQISTTLAVFLLAAGPTQLFGADAAPTGTPNVHTRSTVVGSAGLGRMSFLKAPRPPVPYWLKREMLATRNMKDNAIVKVTIDHGKIVSVVPCCGGNEALSKHLARWVQSSWVADPRMNGAFTLPIKFGLRPSN